jgi:MFS family permease
MCGHSLTGDAALIRFKLSLMMFLEFFIWGAWLPLIFGYLPSLGFDTTEQAWIINAFALASFTAMFFSTQFADRNFAAENFLAFSQLIGGVAILGLFWVREGWSVTLFGRSVDLSFWAFFGLMLVHSLFYVPTISITNSIAFANLRDPQHEFGPVRLWGTIGWIAASWPFVFILVDWDKVPAFGGGSPIDWLGTVLQEGKTGAALRDATRYTFLVSGVASLFLAVLSLGLPHTPPRRATTGAERFAWLEAMKLLRVPFILILFIVTFFDAAVHACYFFWTGRFLEHVGVPGNWVMPVMSIGQVAEIVTMAFLGYCLKHLGWRYTMVIGILGHAVRFAVFAFIPEAVPAIAVNLLHGICYAFFFATVYIFVDEFFPKDARSSAQGLFNFLILGLGPFVGNFVWAYLGELFTVPGGPGVPDRVDFRDLFQIPSAVAVGAGLLLLLFFRPPKKAEAGPLPPHVEDALARDDVWVPPPSEAITERHDGIRE